MDYLTILAERMLVLFPATATTTTTQLPADLSSSPSGTPAPPPIGAFATPPSSPLSCTSLLTLPPPPVAVSLLSLVYHDGDAAHYLANHVLSSAGAHPEVHGDGATNRALAAEAEVLVWAEIARAKGFARQLGNLFTRVECVSEQELADLAAAHGLGLAPARPVRVSGRDREARPRSVHAAAHTDDEAVF